MRDHVCAAAVVLTLTLALALSSGSAARAAGYAFTASSFLGGTGDDDAVRGAAIQSDGTVVLGAELAPDVPIRAPRAASSGTVLRLTPDGTKLVSAMRVSRELKDMAIDDADRIYVAAGPDGLVVLDPKATSVAWRRPTGGSCDRVDAARDGHSVALASGGIWVFDPGGRPVGRFRGHNTTYDVCIDSASETVVFTGFRNAKAFDGKKTYPVQICYLRGTTYAGEVKWTDYDWSTDRESDRFINKPTNNMADTRGYRCSIGRDGGLYAAFESAGGNHIFRYSPTDIMKKVRIAGGDKYHSWHNTRSEHKTLFARYDAATGEYLAGQQFCGRLSSGRGNTVRVKDGDIAADEHGRVYLGGVAAYGLPVSTDLPGVGDYTGGGFLLVTSPDLKRRLVCTRTQAGGGSTHAVAARVVGGVARAAYGGGGMKPDEPMFTLSPLQRQAVGKDGYYAVLGMPGVGRTRARKVGEMTGGGNFNNAEVTGEALARFRALRQIGARMCRVNVYPHRYLVRNDWGRPNVTVLDGILKAARDHGVTPMVLFEYYTDYHKDIGFGDYRQWFGIGKAFAERFRPNGEWGRGHGVTDYGISIWSLANEPEPGEFRAGGRLGPEPYVNALKGLADGVHSVDRSLKVIPGGFMAANAWDDWTLRGIGPAIAPLLNDGTLAGIDLHTYYDVQYAPMEGNYRNSAQDNFDRVKAACGVTADIAFFATEFNYKKREVTEERAAAGFLTGIWDNLGVVGKDGRTPATVFAFPWNIFHDAARDEPYGLRLELDPWKPTRRGAVLELVLKLTEGMTFTSLDPRKTGVCVLEGGGRKLWVWQNRRAWTDRPGGSFTVTGIPAGTERLEVYGWDGLRRTVNSPRPGSCTVGGLAAEETHMFLATGG